MKLVIVLVIKRISILRQYVVEPLVVKGYEIYNLPSEDLEERQGGRGKEK